jgi:YHS domain-containing protein
MIYVSRAMSTEQLNEATLKCTNRMFEIEHMPFRFCDLDTFQTRRIKGEYNELLETLRRIKECRGDYVSGINDDASDPYGCFKPATTFTCGGDIPSALCEFIPEKYKEDGAYGYHDYLVKHNLVPTHAKHDHEYGGMYYYFKTEKQAQNFLDAVNNHIKKLDD